jgi:hypothetical protein
MVGVNEALTPDEANRLLAEWQRLAHELGRLKSQEFLLRARVFQHFFPTPEEGTNKCPLGKGYTLKANYPLNRTVDPEALKSHDNELKAALIDTELVIKYKPEVVTSCYRQLTAEQQKLFDTVLTIKPGAPALEITKPKLPKSPKSTSKVKEEVDDGS